MNSIINTKRPEILVLLQHLAEKLDTGKGTVLESQCFDLIMEILNENIKNRTDKHDLAGHSIPGNWNISSSNPS